MALSSQGKMFSLFHLSLFLLPCFTHALPPASQPALKPIYLPPSPYQPPVLPPTSPPVSPPTQPPVKAPTPPPAKPPTKPPSKPGYIQGMVYCKNCHYLAWDTLYHSKGLAGARVVLKCKKWGRFGKQIATADKNGYFFMTASRILNAFGFGNCRMFLASAPLRSRCGQHTNLNNGTFGALLRPMDPLIAPLHYDMYTVGPFGFQPTQKFCDTHAKPIPN